MSILDNVTIAQEATAEKISFLPYNVETIQRALHAYIDLPIWVASGPDKRPVSVKTGATAQWNKPEQLGTFREVADFCSTRVGFLPTMVLSKGLGLVVIDLDDLTCIQDFVARCGSYTEYSRSGKGLHIFCLGTIPGKDLKLPDFEIYTHRHLITVTGNIYEGYSEIVEAQAAITAIYNEMAPPPKPAKPGTATRAWAYSPKMSDAEVLHMCREDTRENKKALFHALYVKGDISKYKNDASRGDLALCGLLMHWTQDKEQTDRLFRTSKLMRPKWDTKDYRERTMDYILDNLKETYQQAEPKEPLPEAEAASEEKKAHKETLADLIKGILEPENPCANFTTDDLPTVLKNYVDAICETTDSHPILVTVAALGQLSAFIKKKVHLPEEEYFQDLYANMWTLTIQESGGFKTTGMNKACKLALRKEKELTLKEKELYLKEKEIGENEEAKKALEIERQAFTIEKINQSVLLPNQTTPQALTTRLSKGYGGIILSSEFGEWLQVMEASYNQGLKPMFTNFYDVPAYWRSETKTQGDDIVTEPFISICGVSTIEWVREHIKLKDVSSGFFARFLLFCPPKQQKIPDALPKHKTVDTAAETEMKNLLDTLPVERCYTLPHKTRVLFDGVHNEMYKQAREHNEECVKMLEPYLKRWSPYLLKLSMLMQLCIDPNSQEIGEEALCAAMSVLEPAIKSTVHLFKGELGESDHRKKCRKVREYIAKSKGVVKRRELIRSGVLDGGVKDYDYIMDTLTQSEEVRLLHGEESKNTWVFALQLT